MSTEPKYRHLTLKELHNFEKEFIDYLSVNGIDAPEWERLKANEPVKAEGVVGLFSDVIFEGVLRKIEYLEYRSPKQLFIFQCLADKMVLRGLKADAEASIDFNQKLELEPLRKYVDLIKSEKPYSQVREQELFEMLEKGCMITDSKLFDELDS